MTTGPVGRTTLWLALPVLAEQLLNTLVGLVDTFLAGRISPAATSAVGLSAYVGWLASMLVMLIGTGTTALVARYEGRREHEKANHFANQSVTLAVVLGIALFVFAYELAPWFARYCRMTGNAFRITVDYLRMDAVGHLAMSVMIVGCAGLRGVGNMRTPMMIYAVINAVNVIFSWGLVYGVGPLPRMGVTGIVAGTVIAKITGATLTVALLAGGRHGLELLWSQAPLILHSAARILRIGLPAAADGAIMWSGHFVFLAIVSRLAGPPLGEAYFAAHVIAIRVEAFSYLPAVAWAAATATMIGQALGAADPRRAIRCGHHAVIQCAALSAVIATLFFIGAPYIFQLMTLDPRVRAEGIQPFRVLALFQPLLVTAIIYIGALRGAGDTRFPLLITIVGTLFIRIPLGWLFGIVLHGGLLGAWVGMFADMTWRAIAASIRYARGAWVRTRV